LHGIYGGEKIGKKGGESWGFGKRDRRYRKKTEDRRQMTEDRRQKTKNDWNSGV
jgi:hypothetical protein